MEENKVKGHGGHLGDKAKRTQLVMCNPMCHGKVNVSAAAGGHFKYVPTNQERGVEAAECLFSSECLCLPPVTTAAEDEFGHHAQQLVLTHLL